MAQYIDFLKWNVLNCVNSAHPHILLKVILQHEDICVIQTRFDAAFKQLNSRGR